MDLDACMLRVPDDWESPGLARREDCTLMALKEVKETGTEERGV